MISTKYIVGDIVYYNNRFKGESPCFGRVVSREEWDSKEEYSRHEHSPDPRVLAKWDRIGYDWMPERHVFLHERIGHPILKSHMPDWF